MHRREVLIAGFMPLVAVPVLAHSYEANGVKIGHAWALPASFGDGQVFMPLLNTADEEDALLAARSVICSTIELRRNNRYDEPAEPRFILPKMQPFPMRPTDAHLRLIGLRQPLELGMRFPLILDFLNAGEVEVEVYVEEKPGD